MRFRFWGTIMAAWWLLANAGLAAEAVRTVADLQRRVDVYDRAWAAIIGAQAGGRHLRSVPERREAG